MSDTVKVGFVPLSQAARGTLVVFCDDALKLGKATTKALGSAAALVKRAAADQRWSSLYSAAATRPTGLASHNRRTCLTG